MMSPFQAFQFLSALLLVSAVQSFAVAEERSESQVIETSEIDWGMLNPARGALGPRAANLWGDRTKNEPSGFLVKFVDGFQSPPHIHNITYRGVVISGLVHNDDPEAEPMWMPSASYWTQPAGEVHITSAKGKENLVYVEIQEGPYLVQPAEEAMDNGERPLNMHASNIVWLNAEATSWIEAGEEDKVGDGPEIAFLWGTPQSGKPIGTLVKLPAGFNGKLQSEEATLRCVVVQGQLKLQQPGHPDSHQLEPGSYFGSPNKTRHIITSAGDQETVLYVRTAGGFTVSK